VGSLPALRGLVLAAKDPDEQVRIKVVRALESLSSEPSRQILDGLRQDPSRKVRRYTRWALERVRAKGMTEA
jgi:HEAT repeat protein